MSASKSLLRCVVCQREFDFDAGEFALILKHVAYGYDFVHPGACANAAKTWLFPEPGYDGAAFSSDRERVRVLAVAPTSRWTVLRDGPPTSVPIQFWALVEHATGTCRPEAVVRVPELADDPGGAEFIDETHAPVMISPAVPEMTALRSVA